MSLAAKGAFVDLLAYQFANGFVPNDDRTLCRIIGAFPDEWQEIREEVLSKFEGAENGNLVNHRMQKERDERDGIRSKRIAAATKGLSSRWESDDKEDGLTNSQKRARRLANARRLATHSEQEWSDLLSFCGKCVRCGATDVKLVKDHIKPIYQGGSDGIENLQPLCPSCNCGKSAESIDFRPNGWQKAVKCVAKCVASPSPSPSPSKTKTKTNEEYPLTPKGGSRRSATPSAVDLISSIPDDFPESYRPFAEEWAHDKQSRGAKQKFQSDRAFLTSINRMLKYPTATVSDAVEMAIAGGWQGWEQDSIKLGAKVENIRDASDEVEGWSSPNPQPDLDELFDMERIARERDEEAAQIAGEEPEFEIMEESACF